MMSKRGRARRAARFGSRMLVCATALSIGVSVVGTPQRERPHVEGEVHVLSQSLVGSGFDRRTSLRTGTEMVGVTWKGDPDAVVGVRARDADGNWTEWIDLEGDIADAPDSTSPEHRERSGAGPAWLGHDMVAVDTRVVSGTIKDLRLHAIDTEAARSNNSAFGVSAAQAAPDSPLLVTRAGWGADESWRNIGNPGCDGQPRYASGVRFSVVHHTVSSNSYTAADVPALLRGIYYFHTHDRGWCDVAYNFFVDRFGRGFEGRYGGIDKAVIGGHTGGFNTGSTGVAVVGDFETSGVPTAAYSALRSLLAWKLAYHGVDPKGTTLTYAGDASTSRYPPGTPVVVPNIEGHRDTNETSCPGRYLYALLPQLRNDVAADIAKTKDLRLSCDWDGDGVASPGYFFRGVWYLRGSNAASGATTTSFGFGNPTDLAVCGDWDGNGTETIGVVRDGVWYLRQSNSTGAADLVFRFGDPGDRPVVGDWDGSGTDTPGVFRSGGWYLANRAPASVHDVFFGYGDPGDVPVVGNWDGTAADGVGVFRRGVWYLTNKLNTGGAEVAPFGYGDPTDTPLAGDWDGDRDDTPGVSRGSFWYLSNQMRASAADVTYAF